MELTIEQALQQGIAAHKEGKVQDAERVYRAILQSQPAHPDANHNLGVIAVLLNKAEAALPFFKTALEANPSISQYWVSYIDALIKLDRIADAKTVLDQAKGKGAIGESFEQLEQRINELNETGAETDSHNDIQNQVRPNVLDSLKLDQAIRLAKKESKEGSLEDSKRIYNDILARFPKNKQALDGIKSLSGGFIGKASKVQEPTQGQLQSLINLYQQGQLQQTLDSAQQLLSQFPNSLTLYNIQGAAHAGLGQLEAAIGSYKWALKINPDYAEAYINMGNALQDKGDLAAAIDSFKQAIKIKPDYAVAYSNMGSALKDKGDLESAIDSCQQALKIKPDFAEAYYNMGAALQDKGDLGAALDSYKRAIQIKPDYADAYNNMGNALKDKGDLAAAIDSFKQAIKIKPDYAYAYSNMGSALKDKGDLSAAIDSFKQAIKIKPDYADACNNMGAALKDKGDLKAAIDSFMWALKIEPNYAKAHFNLGVLLLEMGHPKEATEHFKFSHANSQYYLLRCLYLQDKKSLFYDQLDYLIDQDEIHPIIGSLVCRSAIKYGIERPNLFCTDPLDYVLQTDLCNQYNFEKIFVSTARTILQEHRVPNRIQPLLFNGYQTSGNLFSSECYLTEEIQKIIRLEIDKYLVRFKDSNEGVITSWPTDYNLYGWLVSMKSGGQLRPHMHEKGWLSGSIYINVPSKSKADSGNLVVCIEEEKLENENGNQEKSIDVVTGSLCLFPASLLHYTIPFESDEERIVLAFDVVPEYE